MDEAKTKLQEEIVEVFNTMNGLSPDSEKYSKTLEGLVKLYELKIAEDKVNFDFQEKEARREMEERQHIDEVDAVYATRQEEFEEKKKQNRFQWINLGASVGITILTGAASYTFHNHWLKKSFKFEEDGTIAGATSRGVWNPLFKLFRK